MPTPEIVAPPVEARPEALLDRVSITTLRVAMLRRGGYDNPYDRFKYIHVGDVENPYSQVGFPELYQEGSYKHLFLGGVTDEGTMLTVWRRTSAEDDGINVVVVGSLEDDTTQAYWFPAARYDLSRVNRVPLKPLIGPVDEPLEIPKNEGGLVTHAIAQRLAEAHRKSNVEVGPMLIFSSHGLAFKPAGGTEQSVVGDFRMLEDELTRHQAQLQSIEAQSTGLAPEVSAADADDQAPVRPAHVLQVM